MTWRVNGASVQGRDVPIAALFSMGESWHNNHHAFPGSARIGLAPNQPDPGWWLIVALEKLGLVWNVVTPATMPRRVELERLRDKPQGCPFCGAIRRRLGLPA
jgi:stearoyl-CoA desaturase (delta-9 desaturase)